MNLTSRDVAQLYPQFMYESILKTATEDPDFEFKVRSTPYPIAAEVNEFEQSLDIGTIVFFAAISLPIMLTVIVGAIVSERSTMHKHYQAINGMHLGAFWCASFLIDTLRVAIVIGLSILMMSQWGYELESAYYVFALFPLGALPFTYATSFIFNTASVSQIVTYFVHFSAILLLSTIIVVLRTINAVEDVGDNLNRLFRLVPSYSIGQSMFFEAVGGKISEYRAITQGEGDSVDTDPWSQWNNLFDI